MKPYQNAIPHEDIKHRETLKQLLHDNAYRHGKFTLSSGQESEHYVNCKPVTLSCEGNALLSKLMIKFVEKKSVAVGGLTLGADPLVCGVAQRSYYIASHTDLDALIIRKNPKGYGTKEVIEGPKPKEGSIITVLEDVTTTGSSAMTAVRVLRDAGYVVNRVVAIVDRMDSHQVWKDNDIEFYSLFLLDEIT
jgi:orotate phosphoribosyltransferase